MDMPMLVRGLIVGVGIAAPVGPIGLLCIQRTLNDGRRVGLASGLGAASADALYGFVAPFGLTLVTAFLVEQRLWLGLGGGLFLLYLGIRTLLTLPAPRAAGAAQAAGAVQAANVAPGGVLRAYGATFLLTLTNPMTILAFVAIFAGAGLAASGGAAGRRCLWWAFFWVRRRGGLHSRRACRWRAGG